MRYDSTTGLPREQITELVARVSQVLASRSQPAKGPGGRPPSLGLYRQVVLVLVLLRQNMIQSVAADLFGLSQPSVSRFYRRLVPIIDEVLAHHEPGDLGELAGKHTVLVDGTDVPTRRFRAGITENYSGKKRRHGLLIQVASNDQGRLLSVSNPVPGRRHDSWALREVGWEEILKDHTWLADPAYVGTNAITPLKKPAGGELNDHDKAHGKQISLIRSAVERAIAHLKDWKILATGYRARLVELPKVIRTVTRLEYYRLGW